MLLEKQKGELNIHLNDACWHWWECDSCAADFYLYSPNEELAEASFCPVCGERVLHPMDDEEHRLRRD